MNKLYLIFILIVILTFVFVSGLYTGKQQCQLTVSSDVAQQQSEIIEIQRNINAKTLNSNVGNIRNVLRQKYTIAD